MTEQKITCTYCGKDIPLTEALSKQIKEGLRKEFESKAREKEKEFSKREEDIRRRLQEIEDSKKDIDRLVAERLSVEKNNLTKEARERAKEDMRLELKDMEERIAEKEKKIAEAQETELELRKKTRELDEKQKSFELEMIRRLDDEREKVKKEALDALSEEHRLKDLEKDKRIEDMRKTIEELKRKSEQGSVQIQGEVLELDIESLLKAKFPADVIEPVPKGIKGADILQKVYDTKGQCCGTIVWESKNTKNWNNDWTEKIKDDQREIKAELAVIVTKAIPTEVKDFAKVDGVWVTRVQLAGCLAEALRAELIEVSRARLSAVGKNEKMEVLYNYLSGPQFRHKVEAIVEAFKTMKEDLDREKRAMNSMWAKREKQMERVLANTSTMYGDMQGIIGASLPGIKALELEAGEEEE